MSNKVFHDCFDRQIKVGDVLAIGERDRNYGRLSMAVVTGFADHDILVTRFQRGNWHERYDGNGKWWMQSANGDAWRTYDSRCAHGERCFITGMSEADLRKIAGITEEQGEQ
jgi:hypothetical protein